MLVTSALLLWLGSTLLLGDARRLLRAGLRDRLAPFGAARGTAAGSGAGRTPIETLRETLGPGARSIGERLARALGVHEDLATRLERVHAPLDPTAFRLRQLGGAVAAMCAGATTALVTSPPPAVALLLLVGAPLLAFLVVEHRLASASARWQRRLFLELPVVAEQLGMLLSAGYSLGAALNRLAQRGHGACAADLTRVTARIRQGVGEVQALREWARLTDVDAVHRLVAVLSLDREASDLGRLIADEARSTRREAQRDLVEVMERRSQEVWVPVTVATLVPGVIFLAVPFIEAMRLFTAS
ncbi:MAG: type II secretion system F family protein [Acidimicrobiales bacterium]|nr:type II secretion system F family protein [Acidimicrobiales bacterium]